MPEKARRILLFLERLEQYAASKVVRRNELEQPLSTRLSLSLAMCGMEDEDVPAYSINDLKQVF